MPMTQSRTVARVMVLITVLFSLVFVPSLSFASNEFDVYGGIESFTWREFGDAGDQILKESGPRYAIGGTYVHEFSNHITLKPRFEIFLGSVDYNGQACDVFGNCLPASTTTDYFGIKLEGDVGYRAGTPDGFTIEPFLGLGLRAWTRSINDSYLIDGSFASGYTEDWSTVYFRLGARAVQSLAPKSNLFAELGVKLPISSTNYIDDAAVSYEAITLHPGNQPSLFAEVGVKLNMFKISAYYDSMYFKKSDIVYVYDPYLGGVVAYWQPKSESDMIGIRAGVAF